tara:strand:- start:140 stop:283 length:144 start_codon:yes stop_codon:yes gene_type:complete
MLVENLILQQIWMDLEEVVEPLKQVKMVLDHVRVDVVEPVHQTILQV